MASRVVPNTKWKVLVAVVVWAVGTAALMLGWMRAANTPQPPLLRGGPRRRLQQQQAYTVDLYLALFYVDHDMAVQLAGNDSANPLVATFCGAVNTQVRKQL
jgi:hypothetical protein